MKNRGKLITIIFLLSFICVQLTTFAHSGRTDSRGGHRDNKNLIMQNNP